MNFFGRYEHTIDEKGRITIPSEYREVLGDSVYVTQGFDGNLQAFHIQMFERLSEQLRSIGFLSPNSRLLRRLLFSNAKQINFDSAGRILIPAFLRETANLETTAMVVGMGEFFEIWTPERWQDQQNALNDVEANEQRFSALDLTTLL
ncbi:MAG: cell division protein MraZ [Chloroflexi bacterium ADurb.Bin120]|uniref:Transcriptional regulator MraZ n=1 Tax=Candidatus Brevifilum fermentans TaxID=1986204 RepID=A0A1Y6K7F2_9CHLR|nr:division/cell wall cluster transcriptional repressor MraZ [Brevefilum fermentans]MDI9565629.1 division/cell wall cluster transcriptional repressor MraZ [Chloroflexota bacterium]OQB88004.1 MAG: cell division protein MraZ [Chloroflexi bacterium ADurb.Bin120]SMX54808.1 Protein MraZ [Brevefilum fermentans]HOM66486.1 division/cell wall cluster transcriptional repressor MraZ [Brevefilum fermentans]HPX95023.1 division/cell wall cluster transcriptional repressor MraZ [Brevefilum fermentans]